MDPLQAYQTFARTCEAGSFSAVASEMGVSQSAISKQIASLERSLNLQLFARTTRRLKATKEALQLYEQVRQLLDTVENLKSARDKDAKARGVLRITMPNAYGRSRICPLLPEFLALHPQVVFDIVLMDRVADLIAERFELGIRIGTPQSSTLIARPIGIVDQLLVATPEYLARHPAPQIPIDLAEHACIRYGVEKRWTRWIFESESGRHAVEPSGPICINDPDSMYSMVCAHQGIALIPDWVVGNDIATGRVHWLLQDYYPIPQPVNVVYPHMRFLSHRARTFVDFLIARLHKTPGATPARLSVSPKVR